MNALIIAIIALLCSATLVVLLLRRRRSSSFDQGHGAPKNASHAKRLAHQVKNASIYDLPSSVDISHLAESYADNSEVNARLKLISQKLAVNQDALKTFFRAAHKFDVPEDEISDKLMQTSQRYHDLQKDILDEKIEDKELQKANHEAVSAIYNGDTRLADKRLYDIEVAFVDQAKKMKNPELMFNAARKRAQRAEVSTLDLNFNKAGRYYRNAHSLTPQDYKSHRLGFLLRSSRYYTEAGMYTEAMTTGENAVQLAESSFGKSHPYTAEALNTVGNIFAKTNRFDKAIAAYQRALAILENEHGDQALSVGKTLCYIADTYVSQNSYEKALDPYQRSMTIFERNYGSLHDKVVKVLNSLVNIYRIIGRFEEAETLLLTYIRRLESQPRSLQGAKLAIVNNSLGLLYMHNSRHKEAQQRFKNALSLVEKIYGDEHPEVARTLNNLANLEDQMGNHQVATDLLRRSLRIVKKRYPEDHPNVVLVSKNFNMVATRNRTV